MLSERDKSVVYSMCQAGMALDTLFISFPQFEKADVEAVYNDYMKDTRCDYEEVTISRNCS